MIVLGELAGPGTYRVPEAVRAAARRGTELRERFGRGGTEVGAARARQLAGEESVDARTVKAMYAYFARHRVDKAGRDWGNEASPSAGRIAWLLWGGDAILPARSGSTASGRNSRRAG